MEWDKAKEMFPVGNIQDWVVKSVVPFGAIMDIEGMQVDAILEFLEFSDDATYPIKYPKVGDKIRCVVLYHSPIDKKVRLSAKASSMWKWENYHKDN